MQDRVLKEKVEKIASQIAVKYKPDKIILFGSAVLGNFTSDSDVDLLVIKDDRRRLVDRVGDVISMFDHTVATDVLVYTPSEIAQLRQWKDPFITSILTHGITLYG